MFSLQEISAAAADLAKEKRLVVAGDLWCSPALWQRGQQTVIDAVASHHREHPEESGLEMARVRAMLSKASVDAAIHDLLIDALVQNGELVRSNTILRRRDHRPALPPRLRQAGERLRSTLAARPFDPPSKKELVDGDPQAQQALRFLLQSHEVTEIGPDGVMSVDALQRAASTIAEHLRQKRQATVSELKALLHSSRRIMVPMLERLDREGVTRRMGDVRVLGDRSLRS